MPLMQPGVLSSGEACAYPVWGPAMYAYAEHPQYQQAGPLVWPPAPPPPPPPPPPIQRCSSTRYGEAPPPPPDADLTALNVVHSVPSSQRGLERTIPEKGESPSE